MKFNLGMIDKKIIKTLVCIFIVLGLSCMAINNVALLFFTLLFSVILIFSLRSSEFRVLIILFVVLFIPTTDYFPFLNFNKYINISIGIPLNMYTITLGIVILATLFDKIYNKDTSELRYINKSVFNFELLYILYILAMVISLVNYSAMSEGLKDILRFISSTYMVFWVCFNNIKGRQSIQNIFNAFIIFVTMLSIYSLVEFAIGKNIYYEMFREWGSNNFVYDGGKRVFSTLGHPNIFASIVACAIPINLNLVMTSKCNKKFKLYIVSLYINIIALVLTFSRGSWISCFISLSIYTLLQKDKKIFLKRIIRYFTPSFIISAISAIAAIILSENIRNSLYYLIVTRLNIDSVLSSGSYTYRIGKILTAKKILSQHPITGIGYSNYSNISDLPQYRHHLDSNVIKVLDNNYLTILVETGIIGMLAFIALFYNIIKNARKATFLNDGITCAIISIIISASSFELYRITPISVTYWVIIGLMFAGVSIDNRYECNDTRIGHIKKLISYIL